MEHALEYKSRKKSHMQLAKQFLTDAYFTQHAPSLSNQAESKQLFQLKMPQLL